MSGHSPTNTLPSEAPFLTQVRGREPLRKAHWSFADVKRCMKGVLRYDPLADQRVAETNISIYQWGDAEGWTLLHRIDAGTTETDLPWIRSEACHRCGDIEAPKTAHRITRKHQKWFYCADCLPETLEEAA